MTNALSPQPFATWPLGTPLPNEKEREADQVTEITVPVQKEETVGGRERATEPGEDEITASEIH
jgi:hypothetical protein